MALPLDTISRYCRRLVDALVPDHCVVCGKLLVDGERYMCLECEADMPRPVNHPFLDNAMHRVLASTIPVERCAAWFSYVKESPYTRLVLDAKYNGRPQLAQHVGFRLAAELAPDGFFDNVDAIVPVPLNTLKMLRRGYNQSLMLARGISRVARLPVLDLLRARRHSTQTRKTAAGRRANARGVYYLRKRGIPAGIGHLVLVDDVVTTGSTMLEGVAAIKNARPDIKVSVLSAALTDAL